MSLVGSAPQWPFGGGAYRRRNACERPPCFCRTRSSHGQQAQLQYALALGLQRSGKTLRGRWVEKPLRLPMTLHVSPKRHRHPRLRRFRRRSLNMGKRTTLLAAQHRFRRDRAARFGLDRCRRWHVVSVGKRRAPVMAHALHRHSLYAIAGLNQRDSLWLLALLIRRGTFLSRIRVRRGRRILHLRPGAG